MAITTVQVSDWSFLSPGDVTLPGPAFSDQSVDVPADAQTDGFLAFTYVTDRGLDSSVDVQFSLAGWTIATRQVEFQSMHVAVPVTPGKKNFFRFQLDKGGTIAGAPPENFGGAGRVTFQNMILFFHRVHREQEHWRWCHKCQGFFFQDNPGSVCPNGGGSHDLTGSGDYHVTLK